MTTTAPKPFVFTLMPFDKKFDDTYKLGIKAAADEAGGYCERVDEQIFEERMLDRIYNQINKADVIVADLTGRNPNVFYEVGYAHALEKRVILLTQNGDDIPFDLKHHYHIVYDGSIIKLKEELSKRLAWYFENPDGRTSSDFQQIEMFISGQKVTQDATITNLVDYNGFEIILDIHNSSTKHYEGAAKIGIEIDSSIGYFLSDRNNFNFNVFEKDGKTLFIYKNYLGNLFPGFWTKCIFPLKVYTDLEDERINTEIPFKLIYYTDLNTHSINFKVVNQ